MASQATIDRLCAEFDTPDNLLAGVVALLAEGLSPTYLHRYRRDEVGGLHEDRLQAIAERFHALEDLAQRKTAIVQQAQERGRLTPELEATVAGTVDQDYLDDLYQSLRPRRRGVAMQLEEKGLLPLAMAIQHRQFDGKAPLELAADYIDPAKELPTPEAALEGALIILADRIFHDPDARLKAREELRRGLLKATPVDPERAKAGGRYQDLLEFAEPIHRIPPGRMLALRRAEREGIIRLELGVAEGRHREMLRPMYAADLAEDSPYREFYDFVFDRAWSQLQDVCGKDVRRRIKERADREAVRTYARNLRSQLLAPPIGTKKVLVLRTSSKSAWAVLISEDGSVGQYKTLPLDTEEQQKGAMEWLTELLRTEQPHAIAVPHGRRQAGSEKLVAMLRQHLGEGEVKLPMVVAVDEAASTIFATGNSGRKAIPGVEVGVRTAISLGRRLQDPLLELARMDARTLGLGQTLDDVHQGMLQRELHAVTASCLAQVGVDLNTADAELLALVPGLSREQADAIVAHRKKIGGFASRAALTEVPGLSSATVRSVAGILRVQGGSEPLDATPIHPDDYPLVAAVAQKLGISTTEVLGRNLRDVDANEFVGEQCSKSHVIGVLQQLQRAKEDVRGELVDTRNEGVSTLADLHADRELKGRVANLTEFGAFIDLGIGQDGLVHISQIPPHRLRGDEMLCVGEVVTVWVQSIDQEKRKISLSMFKPRHLQEGRLPTIGERMAAQGRGGPRGERGPRHDRGERGQRGDRGPRGDGPQQPERPRLGDSRRLPQRRGPGEGRDGERAPREDRGDRGFGDRGPRGPRGPRENRVYTVEPAKEVADTRNQKGELTSLAGLRNLFGGAKPKSGGDGGKQE
ncbi:MAG: hypothetical protein RL398_2534 [Planctomycetota bacterium]|jgi:uncharacterized protein